MMTSPPNAKRDQALVGDSTSLSTSKTRATAEGGCKKRHFYKPLPTRFERNKFDYRQIAREGNAAIYEQTRKVNEDSAAFEVIRIRRREGFEIDGRFVEPAEVYPNSEAWGVDGWTMQDKDAAFRKLREVVAPTKGPRPGKNRGPSEILTNNDPNDSSASFQASLTRRIGDVVAIGELVPHVLRVTLSQARRRHREAA
jgi:hypothetical protein